jgi:putative transposase
VKYRMIERCRDAFPVRMMCRCLRVSPSGYYGWRGRPASEREQANKRLLVRIRGLHAESDGVFGSPRMRDELRYLGERCSRNRVARLMRRDGLRGIPQRRRWRAKPTGTRPSHVQNHLARDFTADDPNTKWVTDITYIRTAEGWLYLAVVVDLYSGRVVGWSMSARQDTQLVLQAVLMALWQRRDRTPVVLHSDRGCQFTSEGYQRFLKGHRLQSSMSKVGSCADNAAAEGFFGLLKRERVNRRQYQARAEARADVFDYIERFHNPRRARRTEQREREEVALIKPSVKKG